MGDVAAIFPATAFAILADPYAMGLSLLGTLIGIILGGLPGISSTMAVAVLMPLTFGASPIHAILFLMGVYYGSVYGGSISAILINIPGTPGALVTQLDGNPMARQGRAGEALTYALIASTFGGVIGLVCFVLLAPFLVAAALHMQSPDLAALMVLGLSMLAYASPGSTWLGLVAGVIGLILGIVGLDVMSDVSRLDFGVRELQAGINLIPVAVGLFGLAEIMRELERPEPSYQPVGQVGRLLPPLSEMLPLWPTALRGSLIGIIIGIIPAAGSAIAVSIAYAQEKRMFGHREPFGRGAPRGVVAPESANNACVGGDLIPTMTLGIPGDSITAVLVGALLVHGLQPGPGLYRNHPEFVAGVYFSLLLAIVMTVLLAGPGIRWFAKVLAAPRRVLLTAIALLCVVGSYAVQNAYFDVLIMIVSGIAGYLMSKIGMPTAPVLFGLVLGPLLEENLRRSLMLTGDWWIFLERPISLCLLLLALVTVLLPAVLPMVRSLLSRVSRAAVSPPEAQASLHAEDSLR